MSRMAFSALSFFFVIIVPLQGNDESNVSLIQTACLVRLPLTAHNSGDCNGMLGTGIENVRINVLPSRVVQVPVSQKYRKFRNPYSLLLLAIGIVASGPAATGSRAAKKRPTRRPVRARCSRRLLARFSATHTCSRVCIPRSFANRSMAQPYSKISFATPIPGDNPE
jgi:hypothetical protein